MITASINGRIGGDPVADETMPGRSICRLSVAVDASGHGATDPKTIGVGIMALNQGADDLAT